MQYHKLIAPDTWALFQSTRLLHEGQIKTVLLYLEWQKGNICVCCLLLLNVNDSADDDDDNDDDDDDDGDDGDGDDDDDDDDDVKR